MACTRGEIYDAVERIIGMFGKLSSSELVKQVYKRLEELRCHTNMKEVEEILDSCLGFVDPPFCVTYALSD